MTIGRALRLVLLAIGDGRPGLGDMCTLGNPAKYTCCLAEEECATSWIPLHVERGLPAHSSAVTLFAGSTAQNVIDKSKPPDGMLQTMAEGMMAAGSNNIFRSQESLLVLGPEHACFAARAGLTRQDVRQRLFAWSRIPLDELTPGNAEVAEHWRHDRIDQVDGRTWLRAVVRPEDLLIVVAGGQGNHSLVHPRLGQPRGDEAAGAPRRAAGKVDRRFPPGRESPRDLTLPAPGPAAAVMSPVASHALLQ